MIDTGTTIKVLGKPYPVYLRDEVPGRYEGMIFRMDLGNGQELDADSWKGLEAKARSFKDVRFDLPFTTRHGHEGSVTGFHAGNGSLLVRWASGATDQRRKYQMEGSMPRLSPEDQAELKRLRDASTEAQKAWNEFVNERAWDDIEEAATQARVEKAGLA